MSARLYYVANARIPTEKAHGIQIAKTCESFVEAGREVELIVPDREKAADMRAFYGLRVPVPLTRIPVPPYHAKGSLGFFMASVSFMYQAAQLLVKKKRAGESFIVYTVDMDTFSGMFLALAGLPYVSEMHGRKPKTFATALFFKKCLGIIAINSIIKRELVQTFRLNEQRVLVEGNAVDRTLVEESRTKTEARAALSLPNSAPIAVYVGRLYAWKELGILAEAARQTPEVSFYFVGGAKHAYESLTCEVVPSNLAFIEDVPSYRVALWLSAADALIVLGSAQNPLSYKYTSPMKVYEYLGAGRAIVASATPAIQEILGENEAFLYTPDDAGSLAGAVRQAVKDEHKAYAARVLARTHTWDARAERILAFIDGVATLQEHAA